MTTTMINSTIERLDRIARRMGLELEHLTVNGRAFDALGRHYVIKPGGKGLVTVWVYETEVTMDSSGVLDRDPDATITCGVDRVSALFLLATETRS